MSIVVIKKEGFKKHNEDEHAHTKNSPSYPLVKVLNLTGHTVNDAMGYITYPIEKMMVPICNYKKVPVAQTENGGIIYEFKYLGIFGLPEPRKGIKYIVSAPVLNAAISEGRTDCIAVNDVIRDREGHVLGCKGFRTNG